METFTTTIAIDAPADRVWAVLADYARDPEWRTGVVEMRAEPAGPAAVGTLTHEVLRLGGRTYRNTGEVRRVVPGERIEWRTVEGADANGCRSVRPTPGGCEVVLELEVRPRGIDRLFTPVLRPMLAKNLRRDAQALATLVGRGVGMSPAK